MADQVTPKARRPSMRERLSTRLQTLRTPTSAKERQASLGQEDASAAAVAHARPAGSAAPGVMSPRSREGASMLHGAMMPGWASMETTPFAVDKRPVVVAA